jgi:hypothetical protein
MKDYEASMSSLLLFIKTFVVHLTAKRALEIYSFRTREHDFNISLFAVERSSLYIPAGSWPNMQKILRESFSSGPSESSTSASDAAIAVNKAIKVLEDKILTQQDRYSLEGKCRELLGTFKKIIQDIEVYFPGGMHCETLLATLGKYFNNALSLEDDNRNLVSICKVL